MQAKRTGGSAIFQIVNDIKSGVGQFLAFCESKGRKVGDLSIFWDRHLLVQHFDAWVAFYEEHNNARPSPASMYNRATYLYGWLRYLFVWIYISDHPELATAMEELSEKKKEYKGRIKAHRMEHITFDKRAALDKFLEQEQINELCNMATSFLEWMIGYCTIKQSFEANHFQWFQRILLMVTYFLCGMSFYQLVMVSASVTLSHQEDHVERF